MTPCFAIKCSRKFWCESKTVNHALRPLPRVAAGEHITADGKLRKVSQRSIYRWLAAYESQGFAGLLPAARAHIEDSIVLPRPLIDFFKNQKAADPWASVPELIRRAAISGLITPDQLINRVTVWRTLKRMGIDCPP